MDKPKESRARNGVFTASRLVKAANEAMVAGEGHIEMNDVAKLAGVSVGLAYHYFGSKAGLIAAVVEAFYDRLDAQVVFAASGERDWLKREQERTLRLATFYLGDPLSPVILGSLRRESAVVEIEQVRIAAQVLEGTRNFRSGQRQGVIAQDVAAADLAAFVLGGVRELMRSALDKPASDRPKASALAKSAWRLIAACVSPYDEHQASNT